MRFAKGLKVALYGGDTGDLFPVSRPLLSFAPLVNPLADSQEKQDIAEQSPIKMGLTYCTIPSPLPLLIF